MKSLKVSSAREFCFGFVLKLYFSDEAVKYKKLGDGIFIRSVNRSDAGEYTCKAVQTSEKISDMKQQTVLLNVLCEFSQLTVAQDLTF